MSMDAFGVFQRNWLDISILFVRKVFCLLYLSSSFALPAYSEPFYFTAIPSSDSEWNKTRFHRLEQFLSSRLKLETKYIPSKNYEESVGLFREGKILLGWFSGVTGVQAQNAVPNSEAIVQGFEDLYFKSFFIAHNKINIRASRKFPYQIKGLRFLFGSPKSTSGRLMPEYYLRQYLGNKFASYFTEIGYSENHSNTIKEVMAGRYDVGVVNYKVWNSAVERQEVDLQRVSVIWETPSYSDYHWVVSGNAIEIYGEPFKSRLTEVLLEMNSQSGLLSIFRRSHFVPARNSDYKELRSIMVEYKIQ